MNIELLIDINVAYLAFLLVVKATMIGLFKNSFFDFSEMVKFFSLKDYIAVYAILIAMSLLISNRYAKKLFKDSAMNTYREEV